MIGETILHYKILEKLGEGGMGVVYLAEDLKLERKVAIKFLPHNISANSEDKERFKIEAKAAASLNHPNIATIYAIEESGEDNFIVMEYIDGKELKSLIEKRHSQSLQLEKVINYSIQIAEGLAAAHKKGIIHRDIKSSNIMITTDGKVKIMDFGLAKIKGGSQLTKFGTTVGTIAYMSPEQTRGDETDNRTDIWSFGVVLYEMVSGNLPFRGDYDQAVIYSILNEQPDFTSKSLIPFEKILMKMLEKDPEKRYSNLNKIIDDLKSVTAKMPEKENQYKKLPCIAVLPFSDLSSSKDQDYFCEGIAEEILNAISRIDGLRVLSRTSSFQFKNIGSDLREIGSKLKVDSVLEGSVRKAGDRLRINVQLVNIADGFQLWSDRYDRKSEDIFEVQDDIAGNVVASLKGVFTSAEKVKMKIAETNIKAYDYFLKGRYDFSQLDLLKAKLAFEKAIELDSNYAPAYAYLANVHSWRFEWMGRNKEDLEIADISSKKSLELAENLSESHTARAFVLTLLGNYKEAENEFMRSIEIEPNSYDAYYLLARMCFSIGDIEKAAGYFLKASEIRKDDFQSMSLLSMVYRLLGREDDYKRTNKEAISREIKRLELDPTDNRALSLGAIDLLNSGQLEKGLEWQEKVLKLYPEEPSTLINATCFFARSGMESKALDYLEIFVNKGFGSRNWIEHDPDYDSLRGNKRFKELLSKLK